jgi:DNA-binding NtrC family response regulator
VDFLEKPIALQKLLDAVAKAIKLGTAPNIRQEVISVDLTDGGSVATICETTAQFPLPLDLPLREARDHFDSFYFNYHMHKENGNMTRVAKNVGLERTHLYRKLKQLDVKFTKKGLDEN